MSKMRVALKTAAAVISGCVLLGSIAPAQAGHSTGTWKYYQPGYPVVPGYPPVPFQPVPRYERGYDGYGQGYRDGYRQARPDYGYDGDRYRYYGRPRYPYYEPPRYDED
ncbi:hypothetical protein SAMN05444161_0918 [Rhizobiales bacterium GAS191]|nr:hypothetical protein SAMN05519103_08409 [Rhizobiales bacterium GAS113]SEC32350.1 hypothetical protein SAMN05444161_0918 [Rhizobiales bacterium GAS191]SEC92945.1 hypothetical protein SAMN05519104_2386 [Rhizobiales bacterium GAS188]